MRGERLNTTPPRHFLQNAFRLLSIHMDVGIIYFSIIINNMIYGNLLHRGWRRGITNRERTRVLPFDFIKLKKGVPVFLVCFTSSDRCGGAVRKCVGKVGCSNPGTFVVKQVVTGVSVTGPQRWPLIAQWQLVPSIGQNLQPFTDYDEVSIWFFFREERIYWLNGVLNRIGNISTM